MKTALRTYHPVPSLQKTDGNAQDAPRIKNCLKSALLPSEVKKPPPSNPQEIIARFVCILMHAMPAYSPPPELWHAPSNECREPHLRAFHACSRKCGVAHVITYFLTPSCPRPCRGRTSTGTSTSSTSSSPPTSPLQTVLAPFTSSCSTTWRARRAR